jgi:predicted phosphodiesterase
MIRLAITSDLHYDKRGHLTTLDQIREVVTTLQEDNPDAVIIAGDSGHGIENFTACLECFRELPMPVGVVAGNHDLWYDEERGYSSEVLWEFILPQIVADMGMIWLENETLQVPDVFEDIAIVGSIAWYDYSAIDPNYQHLTAKEIARLKNEINNDSSWIDWKRTDIEFAQECVAGLHQRLEVAEANPGVRAIMVITHVPILEAQMYRKPYNRMWAIGNAYFGNLTAGHRIIQSPKVQAVVSGHTHQGVVKVIERREMPQIQCCVVPSDYRSPAYVLIEI